MAIAALGLGSNLGNRLVNLREAARRLEPLGSILACSDVIETAPWLSVYPGLAILITVLGYNLLGESLRDMLDPRLKQS